MNLRNTGVQPGCCTTGGVIVQEPKCNTMMCEFQMKFAQWGGVQRGGPCATCTFLTHRFYFFKRFGLNWQNYRSSLIYFFIVVIPTWRCILTFDFYKKQLMRSDILCTIRYVRNLSDILSFISLEIFSAVYLTWLSVSDGLSSSLLEATLLPPSSWQPANPGARSPVASNAGDQFSGSQHAGRRGFGNCKAAPGVLYASHHPTNRHADD